MKTVKLTDEVSKKVWDEKKRNVDIMVRSREIVKTLKEIMLKSCSRRERFIIRKSTEDEWTFARIGRSLKPPVTRQRVQQIFNRETKKIGKIYSKMKLRGIYEKRDKI